MKALFEKIRQILRNRRNRVIITRCVSTLAAVVVFVTTYALILPAITLEKTASCGIEEHQHDDSCYEKRLICGQEESDGHHHTDSCYTVTRELTCQIEEHQHSAENGCYDENGNLICELPEHIHDDSCYQEVKTLTCGLEESEGHHHTDACYEKVLVCTKEVHVHSKECYKEGQAEDGAKDETEKEEESGSGSSGSTEGSSPESADDASSKAASDSSAGNDSDTSPKDDSGSSKDAAATEESADTSAEAGVEDAAEAVTEPAAENASPEAYVPTLDPVNMDAMLNKYTDFYYFHAEDGEEIPSDSTEITDWQQVKDDTELAPTDLVKMYLAYTIPAGSLNETNPTARYRLPDNIHLTDEQMKAINKNENGIYAGYAESDSTEDAKKYLGAEAVEGERRPDEQPDVNAEEYISAVVRVEKTDDGGQELIFTFVPYTIEKNRETFDAEKNPVSAGEKITGWFACDFNFSQIDWVEQETTVETDTADDDAAENDTVDSAVADDDAAENDTVDSAVADDDAAENDTAESAVTDDDAAENDTAESAVAEDDAAENTAADDDAADAGSQEADSAGTADGAEEDTGENTAENGGTQSSGKSVVTIIEKTAEIIFAEEDKDKDIKEISRTLRIVEQVDEPAADEPAAETDEGEQTGEGTTADAAAAEQTAEDAQEYKAGTLTAEGQGYRITLDYTKEAKIPENAALSVREITAETDKEAYEACLAQAQQHMDASPEGKSNVDPEMSRFFDIEILVNNDDGTAQKIEPAAPVSVNIRISDTSENADAAGADSKGTQKSDPTVLHFADEGVEQVDSTTTTAKDGADQKDTDSDADTDSDSGTASGDGENGEKTEIRFEADSFSIYGVVFTVDILSVDGVTYTITITDDEGAGIPEGTKLTAKEIEPGTDEYNLYLGRVWNELNREYNKVEEMRENYDESMGELPDVKRININTARFFDITLLYDGKEIEPKAPVKVEISYDRGLHSSETAKPGVVHYVSEEETDIVEDVETTVLDDEVTCFCYEQDSFSVVGTYIAQETQNIMAEPKKVSSPAASGESSGSGAGLTDEMLDSVIRSSSDSSGKSRAVSTETPYTDDDSGLEAPVGTKTLVPNKDDQGVEDGTYTLTLSVKGHSSSSSSSDTTKSNVLFVMDRSSSMITKFVNDTESFWYYGTWNQDETTFRGDIAPPAYQFYGLINGNYVPLNVSDTWTSWWNYNLTYSVNYWPYTVNYPANYPIYVRSNTTRMVAEQNALNELFTNLLLKNTESGDTADNVEVALISFGDERFDDKSWAAETETSWVSGTDPAALSAAANSNRFTSGTNWEEALQYAYQVISDKKTSDINAGKTDEDYYVVFLTDGEPTAVEGESGSAYHSTDPVTGEIIKGNGNIYAYDEAKDEAKALVDAGYKFYNIFTYRTTEDDKYSVYLTNYAYGNGDHLYDLETDAVKNYYTDAKTQDKLVEVLNNIFKTIESSIGHGNVSITDTLTTDAMTKTVVQGRTNGYVYEVKDSEGTVLYTASASGDAGNPTVTFHVPDSAVEDYTATASTIGGKTVYSVTTVEDDVYKITLADIDDATGELVWDLSAVGILMDDCTYSVSFIVWPDQDAYDYVAALNNGLQGYTWDTNASSYEDLTSTKGYEKGGVEQYPSIVKYPDDTFSVLTNTDQKIHYSVIETETVDGVAGEPEVTGPFYRELPTPEPMPLTASVSRIEKKWNVERDPGILAELLYNLNGSSREYSIGFEILQGADKTHYTDVTLGWDSESGQYIWEEDSTETVTYNGHECEIGTRWVSDFSIATGLMLSTDRMDELGLDKTAYRSAVYNNVTYYILETGHDYTIKEPDLSYEFDFDAPMYHPMLVDGVLKSVDMTEEGNSITITGMTDISVDETGVSTLLIENTLRGYIHLDKIVVDQSGAAVSSDDTKFEYTVTLNNENPVFLDDSIPWFGINGLFYHDEDYNYYQAWAAAESGYLTLTDEEGNTYTATCSGAFNPDIIGPTAVTYTVDGEERTINLYGNQMNASDGNDTDGYKTASATFQIDQNEVLNIANVPVNTTYTITESAARGYELVGISKKIGDNSEENVSLNGGTVEGTIVANTDNNIVYLNRRDQAELQIIKVDESSLDQETKTYLENAQFTITQLEENGIGNYKLDPESAETPQALYYQTGVTTDENGKATISKLQPGYYEIRETIPPAGYLLTSEPVYLKVEHGVITRIAKTENDPDTEVNEGLVANWPENTDNTGLIRFAGAQSLDENSVLTVGNTPGAELPHTGGPGSSLYTLSGIMLMALARAAAIMMKKCKK